MSEERRTPYTDAPRLTPWVGRLMVVNAAVLLLLQTVLTDPSFVDVLQFLPATALSRPWTLLSYMFVHGGVVHGLLNMLLLFAFGPPVERRMGGRGFILFYMYCGVGAALLALGLSSFMDVPTMIGATGAVLGLGLAFAFAWPEAELVLLPFPFTITAQTLILLLGGATLLVALSVDGGIAHLGYLGGMAAGYLFLRIQGVASRKNRREPRAPARRPVMAPMPVRQGSPAVDLRPAIARLQPQPSPEEYPAEEVDRVLDKISAFGIQSLTPDERRFLDEVSKRKRSDLH
jgi:membrane associated rhomboid family serine protease